MENLNPHEASQPSNQFDPKDQKEGYVPFIVYKGTHRILMYIQEGMPLFAGYDAALDIAMHIRDIYRTQVQKAMDEQNKAAAHDTKIDPITPDSAQRSSEEA